MIMTSIGKLTRFAVDEVAIIGRHTQRSSLDECGTRRKNNECWKGFTRITETLMVLIQKL